jgi:hypothetical protein
LKLSQIAGSYAHAARSRGPVGNLAGTTAFESAASVKLYQSW